MERRRAVERQPGTGKLRSYAEEGGCILGVCQPSMIKGYMTNFRLADVLGVDQDTGERCCHGRISYKRQRNSLEMTVYSAKKSLIRLQEA